MRAAFGAAGYLLAALALVFSARDAFACGYCVEDRVAVVYDHGIVVRALQRQHKVAFLAIEGEIPQRGDVRRSIESELSTVKGVDRGTARVSLESASLSFAYDPGRSGLGPIMSTVGKRLAASGLGFSILRVIDDAPALGKAGRSLELRATQP
jgi:hypothetical protein